MGTIHKLGPSRGLSSKESACSAGDMEMLIRSLGQEDPLEKEMTTHSSNLAWEIPRTEDPGRGLQGVGHSRVTKQQ